ncbi:MAG: hypothetical protein ACLSXM_05440, partial [Turicibacter sanguinis]
VKYLGKNVDDFDFSELQQKIQEFDIEARTYRDIIFPTRAERLNAEREYNEIVDLTQKFTINSLKDYLVMINTIKENYTSVIAVEIVKKLEIKSRTVNDIVFDLFSEAVEAETILKNLNIDSINEIELCIKQLESHPVLNLKLINYLKQIYVEKEIQLRTVGDVVTESFQLAEELRPTEMQFQQKLSECYNINDLQNLKSEIENLSYYELLRENHLKKINEKIAVVNNQCKRRNFFIKRNVFFCILVSLVVIGWFMDIKVIEENQPFIYFFEHIFNLTKVEVYDEIGFIDGVTTSIAVFSRSITDTCIVGFAEYLDGFNHGIIGNLFWFLIGGVWLVIKYFIFVIIKLVINFFIYGFQRGGGILYYLSYFTSSLVIANLLFKGHKIIDEAELYE